MAISTAEKNGTTFLGGMLMRTPIGARPMEESLLAVANDKGVPYITPDEVHAAVALGVNTWVRATGAQNVTALHTNDNGNNVIQLIGWDNAKSSFISFVITPDEIAKGWHDYHNQPAALVTPQMRGIKRQITDVKKQPN